MQQKRPAKGAPREARPVVDEAVFAYFCSGLFWVIFKNILNKKLKIHVLTSVLLLQGAAGAFFLVLFFTERVTNQELPKLAQNATKKADKNGARSASF